MKPAVFTTALGSPLTEDEKLHVTGLGEQLSDQYEAGIRSLLVGGTMGMMQMLTDQTWRDLMKKTIELGQGRFELFCGAGDTGFARTRERIEWLNEREGIEGVVVLTPFFVKFSQEDLLGYFTALAEVSRHPLYLYDLPLLVGMRLELETITKLVAHPNIAGVKHSGEINEMRRIHDTLSDKCRVMVSQPEIMDILLRSGVRQHLDGMFTLAPHWVVALGKAAEAGDWDEAAKYQGKIAGLRHTMWRHELCPSFTAIMNRRGISGRFGPRPFGTLDEAQQEKLFADELVAELLAG